MFSLYKRNEALEITQNIFYRNEAKIAQKNPVQTFL